MRGAHEAGHGAAKPGGAGPEVEYWMNAYGAGNWKRDDYPQRESGRLCGNDAMLAQIIKTCAFRNIFTLPLCPKETPPQASEIVWENGSRWARLAHKAT